VLKLCGDNLTRENLLKQATNLKGYTPPLILDGVKIYNSPDNYDAFHNMQLAQFDGKQWVGMGEMISLEDLKILSEQNRHGRGGGQGRAIVGVELSRRPRLPT
jgi:hypothetical protein